MNEKARTRDLDDECVPPSKVIVLPLEPSLLIFIR